MLSCALSFILAELIIPALAQTVQQSWIFPASPDFSSNVTRGNHYAISWAANLSDWFGSYCSSCDPSQVDLWVQTGNDDNHAYKIGSGVNVATTTRYTWVVEIPLQDLTIDSVWVLRFIPFNSSITPPLQQLSSPLFHVNVAASSASSTSTVVATSTSHSTMQSPTQTNQPTKPSSTAATTSDSHSLSKGAQAGIGVGVGVAALLLLASAISFYIARRSRNSNKTWFGRRTDGGKELAELSMAQNANTTELAPNDQASSWTHSDGKASQHPASESLLHNRISELAGTPCLTPELST